MKNLEMLANSRRKHWMAFVALFMLLLSGLPTLAQPGEYCTLDMHSPSNLLQLQKPFDSTISPWIPAPTSQLFQPYQPCPNRDNNTRAVGYIHGLGGSIAAWDKQIQFTDSMYGVSTFGVDYGSGSYEVSFYAVGQKVKNDLADGFGNADQTHLIKYNTQRCHKDDYVIAHSQGGIAARYLDWKWNTGNTGSFGTREFYGLVTFGTPNAGADIALTKAEHYAFVSDVISSVIFYDVDDKMYDLTSNFPGTFIGDGVYNLRGRLDTMIKNQLAPLMLSSVHTPTLDEMSPGSPLMNNLNNHWGRVHRVAFFGTEDEPECWRVMDQVINKGAEEYPLWGAQPDDEFLKQMEEVRARHIISIDDNKNLIDLKKRQRTGSWLGGGWVALYQHITLNAEIQALEKQNISREKSLDFLNNANSEWRYLIGSYHRDSVENQLITIYNVSFDIATHSGGPRTPTVTFRKARMTFKTYDEAAQFSQGKLNASISVSSWVKQTRKFFPSDGVVLARSQQAFPGIHADDIEKMEGNNHFQERNSSETKKVLERLFEGRKYDPYFQLTR